MNSRLLYVLALSFCSAVAGFYTCYAIGMLFSHAQ